MSQIIPYAMAALTVVGGLGEKQAADEEALQHKQRAGESRASAEREAIEARRQARLRESRTLAVAAASGAGASDPDVVNRIADIHGEGEYNALRAMYEGYTASDESLHRAQMTKKAGKRKLISSVINAGGALYGTTMKQKYESTPKDGADYG